MLIAAATGTVSSLLVVALAAASTASAAVQTTAPGTKAILPVLITNKAIAVGNSARMPRGVLVTFVVKNESTRNQNFVFLGKRTGTLKPGGKGSFSVLLSRRGIFPYRSTLDDARPFRGLFIVY
jgi:hypothetical protein